MSWARFDDLYDDNRKVRRAWRRFPIAVALHVMAITYSCRHETDGVVDEEWLAQLLPHPGTRRKAVLVGVSEGLFDELGDGLLRVHDFLEHNRSRAQLEVERHEATVRKARSRARSGRRAAQTAFDVVEAESPDVTVRHDRDSRAQGPARVSRPLPSRTPVPPAGGRQRDLDRFADQVRTYAAGLLPDAPAQEADSWVAGAIRGGARSETEVLAFIRRGNPDLVEGVSSS